MCYLGSENENETLKGKVAWPSHWAVGGPALTQPALQPCSCRPSSGIARCREPKQGHASSLTMTVYSVWARMASFRSRSFSKSYKQTRDTAPGASGGCSATNRPKELVVTELSRWAVSLRLLRRSRAYWHGSLVVSDGFHKAQCLWSGRSNVVHPSLLESANGRALIGGHESLVEPARDEG